MKKNDLMRQKALEILTNEPKGIRLAHLSKRVNEFFPSVKIRTLRWAIWDLDKTHPEQVCKPSKGFFIHRKFKKTNGKDIRLPEVKLQETKDEEFYDSIIDWMKKYEESKGFNWRKCPVRVVKVKDRSAFPTYSLQLFVCIPAIKETKKFKKMLKKKKKKNGSYITEQWAKTTETVAETLDGEGLGFEKWTKDGEKDVYSVRVGANHRAHLWWDRHTGDWHAIKFGTHKEMGHG